MTARACSMLAAVVLFAGCSGEDAAVVRASLAIEARDNTGRHAVLGCEELPLLQGSHRYTRHIVDDVVTVSVMAVPSQVRLDFEEEGKTLDRSRTIPRGALLRDYAEEVSLVLYDGAIYTISLSSGCSE